MIETVLFDWGNTLMVDFPNTIGKMCDWAEVSEVDGAKSMLESLSKQFQVFVATGAADSNANDIKSAFHRVELDEYISDYFCQENLGVGKEDPAFFDLILQKLRVPPASVLMVGDSLERDIAPLDSVGIQGVWFNPLDLQDSPNVTSIGHLSELENLIYQMNRPNSIK